MLTGSVNSEYFRFKSAEVLCSIIYIFTLLTLKEIPPLILVCKDKVGVKSLCLNIQVVENLWFLLRGAL